MSPRARALVLVDELIAGREPLLPGLWRLCHGSPDAELADERDVQRLRAMLEDAEHLPLGPERAHWAPAALARVDRELAALAERHRDGALYLLRRLRDRLAAELDGPG